MEKNISDDDNDTVKQIRIIQERIENVRKDREWTQRQFASILGCSYDVYRNNVNKSKLPLYLASSKLLKDVSETTGATMSYLTGKVSEMYAIAPKTHESPTHYQTYNREKSELFKYLTHISNMDLVRALHFLLVSMPPNYSKAYENMIISTYNATKQLSFLKDPSLLTNSTFHQITNEIELNDMRSFKQRLLISEGDECLTKGRRREALKKYVNSLVVSRSDYRKYDTSLPIQEIIFFTSLEKDAGERIKELINTWPKYEKNLEPYESEVIKMVKQYFKS